MPTTTPNLGLNKAIDGDNAEVYLHTNLAASLDVLDAAVTLTGTQSLSNKTLTASAGITITSGGLTTTTLSASSTATFSSSVTMTAGPLIVGPAPTASAGIFRLPNNNQVGWRNFGNTADALLYLNTSDQLELDVAGVTNLRIGATTIGVFGSTPQSKQAVTGSRGANAALASLLTILASHGYITDSSS